MAATGKAPAFLRTPVPRREFIEVAESAQVVAERTATLTTPAVTDPDLVPAVTTPRWSLWEDAEA